MIWCSFECWILFYMFCGDSGWICGMGQLFWCPVKHMTDPISPAVGAGIIILFRFADQIRRWKMRRGRDSEYICMHYKPGNGKFCPAKMTTCPLRASGRLLTDFGRHRPSVSPALVVYWLDLACWFTGVYILYPGNTIQSFPDRLQK